VTTAVLGRRRATSPGGTRPSMYMRTTWTAAGSQPESSTWTSKAPYRCGRRAKVGEGRALDCSLDLG
jgi:hypothetical protein